MGHFKLSRPALTCNYKEMYAAILLYYWLIESLLVFEIVPLIIHCALIDFRNSKSFACWRETPGKKKKKK